MHLLLVHGMGRTPLSMRRLARTLRRAGHTTELFGYVAAWESVRRISARLRERLERIAARQPAYAVVGHSLGGLVLRASIAGLDPPPRHLVLLGTPNRVPRLAYRLRRFWPYRLATGDAGQLLARSEFFDALPAPRVPYTIIAGTAGPVGRWSPFGSDPNDWLVAVAETRLADTDEPITLPVDHTFMVRNRAVGTAVRRALDRAGG